MKIAIVQMEIVQGSLSANLAKIKKFISKAKQKNADVVVFPEDSLTGIVRKRPDLVDSEKQYEKIFSTLAKENNLDIVCGSFVESQNGKWSNTSCYFDHHGKMLAKYRKINLWHSERSYIKKGGKIAVFNTRFGKAGLAICWDLSDPVLFRNMARLGAEIIYVPSFWSDGGVSDCKTESKNIDSLCHARAFETESAVVYVNAAGSYLKEKLIGHSQIALPIKGAIKKIPHNREKLAIGVVPMEILKHAGKIYKIKKDIQAR